MFIDGSCCAWAAASPLTLPYNVAACRATTQHDDAMAQRVEAAAAGGAVLRYVGTVDVQAGTASVRVAAFAPGHPLAGLRGSDNLIAFTTARYPESTPLVVRGPGAGAEVTAGGVFADLLDVLRSVAGPFRPK
jgi:homoserine dehydrogenase